MAAALDQQYIVSGEHSRSKTSNNCNVRHQPRGSSSGTKRFVGLEYVFNGCYTSVSYRIMLCLVLHIYIQQLN